jgi:hypothetical protein
MGYWVDAVYGLGVVTTSDEFLRHVINICKLGDDDYLDYDLEDFTDVLNKKLNSDFILNGPGVNEGSIFIYMEASEVVDDYQSITHAISKEQDAAIKSFGNSLGEFKWQAFGCLA